MKTRVLAILGAELAAFVLVGGVANAVRDPMDEPLPVPLLNAPAAEPGLSLPAPRPVPPMPAQPESPPPAEPTPSESESSGAAEGTAGEPETAWHDYLGSSRMQIAAIQTLLDREHFSPGVIDGVWGPKSQKALRAWQQKHGLPAIGEPDKSTFEEMGPLRRAFQTYVVTEEDHEGLAPVPATWMEKSRAERLGYETVKEKLAERFHCSRALLPYLNPKVDWPNPPAGTKLVVPNVKSVRLPEAARIEILLHEKTVQVLDTEGRVVAFFPCSIGRDKEKRPRGELHVTAWAENPTYYFDPAVFPEDPEARTIGQKLIIPPGPNNPVGTAWISLSLPGYGIHGTPIPEDIGKTESHGCFRLANWNAEKLIRMVRAGLPVIIE